MEKRSYRVLLVYNFFSKQPEQEKGRTRRPHNSLGVEFGLRARCARLEACTSALQHRSGAEGK